MMFGLSSYAAKAASSVFQSSWWRIIRKPAGTRGGGRERFGAIRMHSVLTGWPAGLDRVSARFC